MLLGNDKINKQVDLKKDVCDPDIGMLWFFDLLQKMCAKYVCMYINVKSNICVKKSRGVWKWTEKKTYENTIYWIPHITQQFYTLFNHQSSFVHYTKLNSFSTRSDLFFFFSLLILRVSFAFWLVLIIEKFGHTSIYQYPHADACMLQKLAKSKDRIKCQKSFMKI